MHVSKTWFILSFFYCIYFSLSWVPFYWGFFSPHMSQHILYAEHFRFYFIDTGYYYLVLFNVRFLFVLFSGRPLSWLCLHSKLHHSSCWQHQKSQFIRQFGCCLIPWAAESPSANVHFRGVTDLRVYSDLGAPFLGSLLSRPPLRFHPLQHCWALPPVKLKLLVWGLGPLSQRNALSWKSI